MSRYTRRTPIVGYSKSEKKDKVAAHRKLRRIVTEELHARTDTEVLPDSLEVASVRDWRKAPRGWQPEICKVLPKLMRK